MGLCTNRVKCGEMEWVKTIIFRWFGHIEGKKSEEFDKKLCE